MARSDLMAGLRDILAPIRPGDLNGAIYDLDRAAVRARKYLASLPATKAEGLAAKCVGVQHRAERSERAALALRQLQAWMPDLLAEDAKG